MNILLTGGTGYIGSHIAVVFAQMGYRVVLYDNLSNSTEDVVEKINAIAGSRCILAQGDVRDTALLQATLSRHRIDAVVHLAGSKAVAESVARPVEYYANNVQGTISLLQAMSSVGTRMLVFSSSATVYGQPSYLPIDEAHPTGVTSPYGRSKLHIEELLKDVAASDPNWRIVCLRYFNPVGSHETALLGEKPIGRPNNLVPFIAEVAIGKRDIVRVFGDDYHTPDGTGLRDYVHVMDLAEGHEAAMKFLQLNTGWHAINLGTGIAHSVLEMIRAFEVAAGKRIPLEFAPRRPGDVAACFGDPSKAEIVLGWKATRTIESMCRSTLHFYTNMEAAHQTRS